jgi:excisionase family DNA binding protein
MIADRLYRVGEVAALLGCSPERICQMVRDRIIPTVRLGRSLRFRAAALQDWLEAGGRGHAAGWCRRIPEQGKSMIADNRNRREP